MRRVASERLSSRMSADVWLSGFVVGLAAGVPVAIFLHAMTRPVVDFVLGLAHRGRL